METTLEFFQKRRTEIIGKMLDNPDENGIYPTSECFNELDELFSSLVKSECSRFLAFCSKDEFILDKIDQINNKIYTETK